MSILDHLEEYEKIDPANLLKNVSELPEQLKAAWEEVKGVVLPSYYTRVQKVVVLGIGGSAIAGYLAKSYSDLTTNLPFLVFSDYRLPQWVDKDCLVLANSYSGDTEETLSALQEAIKRRCKIVAVTTGGKLAQIALSYKFPLYRYEYKSPPRQALGYSLGAILGILNKLALISLKERDLDESVHLLQHLNSKINPKVTTSQNQAKQLAEKLYDKIVIILSGELLNSVARRFKTQLNENSKQMAFFEILPESCHNFIVGLEFPAVIHQKTFLLILSSKYDHKRVMLRRRIVEEIFAKSEIEYEELQLDLAMTPLAEILSFVYLLDYTSFYLAILNKVDPERIDNIKYLKQKLSESL